MLDAWLYLDTQIPPLNVILIWISDKNQKLGEYLRTEMGVVKDVI